VTDHNIMRLLAGLVEPLLSPLDTLPAGAHVVQLACGTGGLSLALARRRPDLRITAIDIDPAVLAAGRADAARERLTVDFRRMSMVELEFADGSVDAVVSRMGLLMSGIAPFDVSSREAARVLRPGGILSVAAWADLVSSPYTRFGLRVLRRIRPDGAVPDFEAFFGRHDRLEEHLATAGFADVDGSWFDWETEYPDFDAWWAFVAGFGPLRPLFDGLDDDTRAEARRVMAAELSVFRTESGAYRLPATARLIAGHR
jgi:ubiquinone/menaquinone biosynthesis C-methylase UbiE